MLGSKSAIVWAGVLAVLFTLSGFHVARNWRLQTDVLALLPQNERDPALQSLRRMASGALGRTALFVVAHEQPQIGRDAARQLGSWMTASPLFKSVQWDYSRQQHAFFDLYFPLRYQILSPNIRRALNMPTGYQALLQRLQQTLYQPTSAFATRFLDQDPLLFFPALAQDWGQPGTRLHVHDGLLTGRENGRWYYVIIAQLAFNPFATQAQINYDAQWAKWDLDLRQSWPEIQLTSTSVAHFASATRQRIHTDIARISLGSILGVVLLTLSTFHTLKHLALALLPIGAGIWSALGITLWIFGELHALTLAFGASLIGICIDYSFHYFAHHRMAASWRPQRTMRRLLPALSLGALTTVLSYLGLALTPLVGLRQIAVFASCGILVSFGTVAFCFPHALRHPHARAHQPPRIYQGARCMIDLWNRFHMPLLTICGLGIVLGLTGLWSLRISDSPQVLNALPQEMVAQDQAIRRLMGETQPQTHLIVTRDTAESALQTLETMQEHLSQPEAGVTAAPIRFGPVLTDFLPSMQRQKANWAATQTLLAQQQTITAELIRIGLADAPIEHFFQTLQRGPGPLLRPQTWLRHDASAGLRHLWLGETDGRVSILVPVRQVHDIPSVHDAVARYDGVYYVDPIEDFTRIFKRYRQQAIRLAGGAYLLVFALLLWRYGKRGVLIMLPPLLAALITVELLGLLGQTFHLMHGLALLLILGMGVDYTIFLAESPPDEDPITMLAITLSALTTLLSFGLLSVSSQAVLQSIGLTTLIGVASGLLLAPIARYGRTSS
ncbi:MAG: MMPL family transporter [Candidatus Tectomicrobia bacterium]|nr:MMPL family transporter [Candidatus Tectomicrobia bacterium]